jgi:DNA-directed RNA polymerase specialized sigma24 family protein
MAKNEKALNWNFLTDEEKKTLKNMQAAGIEPRLAPIEIEAGNEMQLESLSITSSQFRTWRTGSEKKTVHPTPCIPEVADFLIKDMRKTHRQDYRNVRCKIPGTIKPLIRCPECNKCSECPYPKYRDAHQPDNLSWERLIGDRGNEPGQEDQWIHLAEVRELLRAVCREIDLKNPKYTRAVILRFYFGYDIREISEIMGETERNVYYFINQAIEIGTAYKNRNDL